MDNISLGRILLGSWVFLAGTELKNGDVVILSLTDILDQLTVEKVDDFVHFENNNNKYPLIMFYLTLRNNEEQ